MRFVARRRNRGAVGRGVDVALSGLPTQDSLLERELELVLPDALLSEAAAGVLDAVLPASGSGADIVNGSHRGGAA